MRDWEERCNGAGVTFATDYVIVNETPDADGDAACQELGKALV